MKRLFWDIETSPNIVLSWRVGYEIDIDQENILHERAIICIGYKWEGSKQTHALTWDKDHNDKAMLTAFSKVAAEADEMVAHNGDRFDLPWIKTRCILHGIPTLPDYKTIDTLQWSKRKFNFNSNKLDYIARYLGLGGKLKTEFGLWKAIVLHKDAAALKRMVTYCKRDVELLEKVYHRLEEHVGHKTHAGVLAGGEKWHSPFTGTTNVKHDKKRVTAGGAIQHQMQCQESGRYYRISVAAYDAWMKWKKKQEEKAA